MNGKRWMDMLLILVGGAMAWIGYFEIEAFYGWIFVGIGLVEMLWFLRCFVKDKGNMPRPMPRQQESAVPPPSGTMTELVLLNEQDQPLTAWTLYGRTGLVIGRDVGENQVDVNLNHSAYASTVEVEHAVLNYSGESWYIEDLASKNGVSVQKREDGRKYKLAAGKPCKLATGDILHIGLVRLMIR